MRKLPTDTLPDSTGSANSVTPPPACQPKVGPIGPKAGGGVKFTLFVDGAARGNPGPAGAGAVIQDESGRILHRIAEFLGHCTNNVAEYRALQIALQTALKLGAEEVSIFSDSELLVRQISGDYKVRQETLRQLRLQVDDLLKRFEKFQLTHIPREKNKEADKLANQAIDGRKNDFAGRPGDRLPGSRAWGEETPDSTGRDGL